MIAQLPGRERRNPLAAPDIEIVEIRLQAEFMRAGTAGGNLEDIIQNLLTQIRAAVGIDAAHRIKAEHLCAFRAGQVHFDK